MKLLLDIDLNPKQKDMYNQLNDNTWKEILFYGSSRSGKTFLILFWMIIQCVCMGANCLVMRNTFESLNKGMLKQTLPAILKAIAKLNGKRKIESIKMKGGIPFCIMNNKDHILTFFNGSYIQFASLRGSSDNETSYDKILSTEWAHIFVDEISEVDEKSIDTLRSRLAQNIIDERGYSVRNKLLFALNPTTKLHWSYIRYFKHEDRDGLPLPSSLIKRFLVMHFSTKDNSKYVAKDYQETLNAMSAMQKKRFRDGEYSDESEGEIFKKITWGELPPPYEFSKCLIYTDPSAKDQKTNDYKASVLLGIARNKIWLIGVRAIQGTSRQMIQGMHELYNMSPIIPEIYMERKQVPLDFETTFNCYQNEHNWICPLLWDTRNNGNKFTNIESTLEPLFATGRFVFNTEIKNSGYGEETINQFLTFSKKINNFRKDDIPDAAAKGTSLLNRDRMENNFCNRIKLIRKKIS